MRITQRELRKIIREELSRTGRGLQESGRYVDPADVFRPPTEAEEEHFDALNRRKEEANKDVERIKRSLGGERDVVALHIVPADDRFWFHVLYGRRGNAIADVPRFFKLAFMHHLPDSDGGPLEVWRKLIAHCRNLNITHITTDFLHEMGLPVEDESIITLGEFVSVLAEAEEQMHVGMFGDDEPALEDM